MPSVETPHPDGAFHRTLAREDASSTNIPADRGCRSAANAIEDPKCDDDLDSDGDGTIDWDGESGSEPPDVNCKTGWKNKETSWRCGLLGVEIVLPVPIGWYRRRTAIAVGFRRILDRGGRREW